MSPKNISSGEASRRINKYDEEKLYAAIRKQLMPTDSDSAEERERKRKRAEKVRAFQEKHLKLPSGAWEADDPQLNKAQRRLTYETVPLLLKASGLSYKDLLEITNGDIGRRETLNWNSKVEKNMCALCDTLPKDKRKAVYAMVMDVLPDRLKEILHSTDTTGNKAFDAAEARTNEYDYIWSKIKGDIALTNIYVYRSEPKRSCDLLPFYKFKKVSDIFDVSYHWLLGLDEDSCVLARHGDTEMIMDAFCMLSDSWKQRICAGVKAYAETLKNQK